MTDESIDIEDRENKITPLSLSFFLINRYPGQFLRTSTNFEVLEVRTGHNP